MKVSKLSTALSRPSLQLCQFHTSAPIHRCFSTATTTPSLHEQNRLPRSTPPPASWRPSPSARTLGPISKLTPRPRPFSTTSPHLARGGQRQQRDPRIRNIRYHLTHPLLPRPLRLSRTRALRHWTIHRGWQLFRRKQRLAQEQTLERQYNSMRDACEALRLIGEDGLAVPPAVGERTVRPPGARDPSAVSVKIAEGERKGETIELDVSAAAEQQKEVGRLYRIAMEKKGIFQGVPIEYARLQTDTPSRAGWDHAWTRQMVPGQSAGKR